MSRRACATILSILFLLTWHAAAAEPADPGLISAVDVGFSGRYKAGVWTPVRVHVQSAEGLEGAVVSVTVPDGDGAPSRVSAPLPSPAPSSVLLYVRFGRVRCEMHVRVDRADEVLAERRFTAGGWETDGTFPPALLSEQRLIVAVGRAPLGIDDAVMRMREPDPRRSTVVYLEDAAELPDRWYGYESVAAVVLSGTDRESYAGLEPDDDRVRELATWVRRGGRLVIAVGELGEDLLAEGKPLAPLVPGTYVRTVPLSQARSLEVFSDSPIPMPMRAGGRSLRVAQLVDVDGLVSAGEGNLPLVVHRQWQFGQTTFLATDLDRGPLGEWKGRERLVARLLGWPVRPTEDMEEDKAILHYGYTDLAGQLRSALDQFEGVRQIPFAVILSVIAAYLLVIGPGDYYFLHKVLRRMELTWVTFPATVILFSAGAYYFGVYTKGNAIRVNQATVVDVDVRSGSMRGTAWANVFSPRMQRYDVAFTVEDLSADASPGSDATIGWLGLPGRALGGMNPATPPPAVWAQPYDLHPEGDIAGFPIQTWSSKSLTTRWFGDAPETIECQLQEEGPIPAGTIANRLDFPLENCLLAYGNWVYELGTLEPGRSVRIGPTLPRRELAGFLTGRRLVFDEAAERSRQRATPYDLDSVDVSYILRAMMFFDAAGGRPYARLSHTYQGFVDLSNLLRPDRAVLLAQPVEPLTAAAQAGGAQIHLSIAGTPAIPSEKHTTVYRFVLPVTPKSER